MANRFDVSCYPILGKAKALRLCEAFAAGVVAAGGAAHVCTKIPAELGPGAAMFYGVRPAVEHLWRQAQREARSWWYVDNAYFDVVREKYFRVTKNAVQCSSLGMLPVGNRDAQGGISFGSRLEQLGIEVQPWRKDGAHIVVCPQSDEYMRVICGWKGNWLEQISAELRQLTKRPLVVRMKGCKRPLVQDLQNAWALVTHTSAAAVEAALAGVPVFVTGWCAASVVAMNRGVPSFARLEERPQGFDVRWQWAEGLARMQWTLDEISKGHAWTALNG